MSSTIQFRRWFTGILVLFALELFAGTIAYAGNGTLEMRDGYFGDPLKQDYFILRGIAYHVWNPPVGADQSFEQLDYDLLEFKKMYASSVRGEFVWGEVQTGPDTLDWRKPDHLVAEAEKLGLKLFVIIGFQYPPKWFPPEWRAINEQGLTPETLDCPGSNKTGHPETCLPTPALDCLRTNDLSADVINIVFSSLASNVPSQIIGALRTKLSGDDL